MSDYRPSFGTSSRDTQRRKPVVRQALGVASGAVVLVVLVAAGSYASTWFGATDRKVAGPGGGSQTSPVADLPLPQGAVRRALEQQVPQDIPQKGLVYDGLKVAVDGACVGLYELESLPGQCSHGPDAPQPGSGLDVKAPVAPLPAAQTVTGALKAASAGTAKAAAGAAGTVNVAATSALPCFGNGTAGNRVEVLYVYAGTDRSATYLESIRTWAVGVDNIFVKSAAATGGVRHIRFVTQPASGGCLPVVTKVRVGASEINDFDATIRALRAQGFDRTDRKYLKFVESLEYCGMGTYSDDARKSAANRNNFGPSYARVDNGCWDPSSAAHELGHNLGAVADNAPNSSRGGHCVDEWDVMCYSDAPNFPRMVVKCADRAQNDLLDCGKDDYFSTSPQPGSYLATNYNIADNTFLEGGAGDGPPPTASPTPRPPTPPTPTQRTQYRLQAERSGLCLGVPRAQATRRGAPILQFPCRASDAGQQFLVKGDSLIVKASRMCVAVAGGSRTAGASIVQQRCGIAADVRRLWSSGRAIGFRHSGQCIDVGSAAARGGSRVVQRPCRGTVGQRFKKI